MLRKVKTVSNSCIIFVNQKYQDMKYLALLTTILIFSFSSAQSLTHITGKRLYEHHSSGAPNPDYLSQSGYDFVNNTYYPSQSFTITYNASHRANIDIIEYGGAFSSPQNFGFTSDSFTASTWIRANGTTRWVLAPSSFNYNTVSDVAQIRSVYNSLTPGYISNSVSANQVYLGRIRNTNKYVALKVTNVVNIFPNPPSVLIPNQYFDFEYKFGTFSMPPVLLSPNSSSNDIKRDTFLKWKSIVNATSYNVQISTNSNLNSAAINNVNDTIFQTSNLLANTQYFWRVRGQIGSDYTDWSTTWNFRTKLDTSVQVTLTLPSNGALDIVNNTKLIWRKLYNALLYEYQIGTDSNSFTYISSIPDTSILLNGLIYNTKYYWRVRGKRGQDTSGWSSIWSFITKPIPPIAPSPILPINQTGDMSVVNQYLKWSKVSSATYYEYQYSNTTSFNTIYTTNNDSVSLPSLNYMTKYYWRVRARNHLDISPWSNTWSFTTKPAPPLAPILSSPNNYSIDQPLSNTLLWNLSTNATHYDYQYSEDSGFANTAISSINTNSASISLSKYNTVYYWRVRARNHLDTSLWSNIWSFSTKWETPSPPDLVFPKNQSKNLPIQTQFSWSARKNTLKYELIYSLNPNFIPNKSQLLSDTVYPVSLQYYTTIYWKVRGINRTDTSVWSPTWSFNTRTPVNSPILKFPVAGTQNIPIPTYIKWTKDPYAIIYDYQVSLNSSFTNSVISSTEDTFFLINNLQYNKLYYWRVRSRNELDTSSWTEKLEFRTKDTPPKSPQLMFPENNSLGLAFPIEFSWSEVNKAEKYDIELSNDEQFSSIFRKINSIRMNKVKIYSIPQSSTFYWRVRSRDFNDSSNWSNAWQFKVKGNFSNLSNSQTNTYKIFPNPTNGYFQVDNVEPDLEFELIDLLGNKIEIEEIKNLNSNSRLFVIPIENANGLYFLKIINKLSGSFSLQRINLLR